MSLQPKEIKAKRVCTIPTGTHLVAIMDIQLYKNAAREPILDNGIATVIVRFKNGKAEIHDQHYRMDKGFGHTAFEALLDIAGVKAVDGQKRMKSDAIGKRLWVCIKEVHYVDDDKVVMNMENKPSIEKYIFKTFPFINGGRKPLMKGDPADNEGIPSGHFIDYKNVFQPTEQEKEVIKQTFDNITIPEAPVEFGDFPMIPPNVVIANEEPQF